MSPTPAARDSHAASPPRVTLPMVGLGLAIVYAPSYLPSLLRLAGGDIPAWGPAGVLLWNWLAVGLLALHVGALERLDAASLRLAKPTTKDVEWALYLGGAANLWHWGTAALLPESMTGQANAGQTTVVALGPLLALALVLTTSVTEEVLWRGYVVERLGAWIGPLAAAAAGMTIFALGHLSFFGWTWLLTNLPGAIALYALLLWRRNLWSCIICHAVLNMPIVVLTLLR
ncbi:MAG: CPBP family intramembrane metalloprotease [Propionibacteriaceae bacterium]|nr:CPBP family intramembrane metalloprotease [Propionibacteriaceae bacterium]